MIVNEIKLNANYLFLVKWICFHAKRTKQIELQSALVPIPIRFWCVPFFLLPANNAGQLKKSVMVNIRDEQHGI